MTIAVLGAGAFGTALAVTLARAGKSVTLWGRDQTAMAEMRTKGQNARHLPGADFPQSLRLTGDLADTAQQDIVLLAMPAQALAGFVADNAGLLDGRALVACCKGIDLATLQGPTGAIARHCPDATAAILTGPSFAADIARGLPTALTLACSDDAMGRTLQSALGTQSLRLYRTTDTTGAELGGALKNVIAIACGAAIAAGLGESARAALMTRGYAEMQRLAAHLDADPATLAGLSGFGDLVLTCTSTQSRNFRFGQSLVTSDAMSGQTVEGAATAGAALKLAQRAGIDMPITAVVTALVAHDLTVTEAMETLLNRPQTTE